MKQPQTLRKYHLNYDQVRYVSKEAHKSLNIQRIKTRKIFIERLSQDEEKRLIAQAYRDKSEHACLLKLCFKPEPEFRSLSPSLRLNVYFDELMILIEKRKGK